MEDARPRAVHVGLLVLRIGIGLMFVGHGLPKMLGGPETWAGLGGAMANFGITFAPRFWGFMAAFAEAAGGLAILLGLFTRPFAFLMLFTMVTAATMHVSMGLAEEQGFRQLFGGSSHAIELGVVFLALLIAGSGRYALRYAIRPLRKRWYA